MRNRRRRNSNAKHIHLFERLESRVLLAASPFGTNPLQPLDVTRDGNVSALDALVVINSLSRSGQSSADPANNLGSFIDVSGDGQGSALDALLIINALNRDGALLVVTPINDAGLTPEEAAREGGPPRTVEAYDLHTDDYGLRLRIQGGHFEPLIDTVWLSDGRTTVDITDRLVDRTVELPVATIDELFGGPQPDGDVTFVVSLSRGDVLQSRIEVPLTIQRRSLRLVDVVASPVADGFSLRLTFNKAIRPDLVRLDSVRFPGQISDPDQPQGPVGPPTFPTSLEEIDGPGGTVTFRFDGVVLPDVGPVLDLTSFVDLLGREPVGSGSINSPANTATWNNPAGGLWSNPSNWLGGQPPRPGDSITIETDANAVVVYDGGGGSEQPFSQLSLSGTFEIAAPLTIEGIAIRRGNVILRDRLSSARVTDLRPESIPDEFGRISSDPPAPAVRVVGGSTQNVQFDADVLIDGDDLESGTNLFGIEESVTFDRRLILRGTPDTSAVVALGTSSDGRPLQLSGRGRIEFSTTGIPADAVNEGLVVNLLDATLSSGAVIDPRLVMVGGSVRIVGPAESDESTLEYSGTINPIDGLDFKLERIDLGGGSLVIDGDGDGDGRLTVAGLANGQITATNKDVVVNLATGVLRDVDLDIDAVAIGRAGKPVELNVHDGITVGRELLIDGNEDFARLSIVGSMRLNGRLTIAGGGSNAEVQFSEKAGSIVGTGTIDFNDRHMVDAPARSLLSISAEGGLTIDPSIRIEAMTGEMTSSSGAIRYAGKIVAPDSASGLGFGIGGLDTGGGTIAVDGTVRIIGFLGDVAVHGVNPQSTLRFTRGSQSIGSAILDIDAVFEPNDGSNQATLQLDDRLIINRTFTMRGRGINDRQTMALGFDSVVGGTGELLIDGQPLSITGPSARFESGLTISGDGFEHSNELLVLSTLRPAAGATFHLSEVDNDGGTLPLDLSDGGNVLFSESLSNARIIDVARIDAPAAPKNDPAQIRFGVRNRNISLPSLTLDNVVVMVDGVTEGLIGHDVTLDGELTVGELEPTLFDQPNTPALTEFLIEGDWDGNGALNVAEDYFIGVNGSDPASLGPNLTIQFAGDGGFVATGNPSKRIAVFANVVSPPTGLLAYSNIDNLGRGLSIDGQVRLGNIRNAVITSTDSAIVVEMLESRITLENVWFDQPISSIEFLSRPSGPSTVRVQGEVFVPGDFTAPFLEIDHGTFRAKNLVAFATVDGEMEVDTFAGTLRVLDGRVVANRAEGDLLFGSSLGPTPGAEQPEPILEFGQSNFGSSRFFGPPIANFPVIIQGELQVDQITLGHVRGDGVLRGRSINAGVIDSTVDVVLSPSVLGTAFVAEAYDGTVFVDGSTTEELELRFGGINPSQVFGTRSCDPDRSSMLPDGEFFLCVAAVGVALPAVPAVDSNFGDRAVREIEEPVVRTVLGRGMVAGTVDNSIEIVIDIPTSDQVLGGTPTIGPATLRIVGDDRRFDNATINGQRPMGDSIGVTSDGSLVFEEGRYAFDNVPLSPGRNVVRVDNVAAGPVFSFSLEPVSFSVEVPYVYDFGVIDFTVSRRSETLDIELVTTSASVDVSMLAFTDGHNRDETLRFENAVDFAARFAPDFFFDEISDLADFDDRFDDGPLEENYFPTSVESFLAGATLITDRNGDRVESLPDGTDPADLRVGNIDAALVSLIADPDTAIDLVGNTPEQTLAFHNDLRDPTVYFQVIQDPFRLGRIALTYWIHYAYSNWRQFNGTNNHEGDWESITVFFEGPVGGPLHPIEVAYSQHAKVAGFGRPGDRVSWELATVDKTDLTADGLVDAIGGTNPSVYVGLGGHASYPVPGVTSWLGVEEYHRGRGVQMPAGDYELTAFPDITENSEPVLAGTTLGDSWALFPGLWGDSDLLGINGFADLGDTGPRGPVFLPDGRYHDPWTWAEDLKRDAHVVVESVIEEVAPASQTGVVSPTINVLFYYPEEDFGAIAINEYDARLRMLPSGFFNVIDPLRRSVANVQTLTGNVDPFTTHYNQTGLGFRFPDLPAGIYAAEITRTAFRVDTDSPSIKSLDAILVVRDGLLSFRSSAETLRVRFT